MLRRLASALLLLAAVPLHARGHLQGYVERTSPLTLGGITYASPLDTRAQRTFPSALVTVYVAGTLTTAIVYSDSSGTTKPNPFSADSAAFYSFYTDAASVDIRFAPSGVPAWTVYDQRPAAGSTSTIFDVKAYGARGDLRTVTDAAITNTQTLVTSATAAFTAADIGKQIQIAGAGVAGATLYSTIASVTSSTQASLVLAASTTVVGATCRIYTDDGAAIILASAAVQANGGGTLLFTPGSYGTYGKGTVYGALGVFSNLTGTTLQCDGCTLYFSGEHTLANDFLAFSFSACSGITIDGFNVLGEVTTALTQSGTFHGAKVFQFLNGCSNINIPRLHAQGVEVPVEFYNNNGGVYDGLPHSRNIHIGLLDCSTCIYGLDAQWSMDDAVIDMLKTDTVTRDFFIYGSSNVTANIHSRNAWADGVKLWSGGGYGLSNIRINYSSDATSTGRSNSGALVELEFNGPTATTHRNIWINFDVVFPGNGVSGTGLTAFILRKTTSGGAVSDTVDRGHILDGLTITGRIQNYPQFGGYGIIALGSLDDKWGTTLDSWYNIQFRDLHLSNTLTAQVSAASLKGPLLIENVVADLNAFDIRQQFYSGAPDSKFPATGRVKVINSDVPNLYVIGGGGELPIGVVYEQADTNVGIGWQDQTIVNTGCGGTCTATLPSAVIGRSYTFSRTNAQTFRIAPQAADQIRGAAAINKYISMNAIGDTIRLTCNATGQWDVQYYAPTADFSFQP